MDAQFIASVYNIVQIIPRQKVMTCADVAYLLGVPKQARKIRQAVNFISHTTAPGPCHRVISSSGIISIQETCSQQRVLEAEGVEVIKGSVGELRVDLKRWGWFPDTGVAKVNPAYTTSNVNVGWAM